MRGQGRVSRFLELLDKCKAQVEKDPASYLDNPQLDVALHRIYLRLCHGNIPEHGAEK